MRAKEGLPLGVLVVVPHQQVEQRRRFCPQRGQLGDAALEHLTAQGLAQCHAALEEHRRELAGKSGRVRRPILARGSGSGGTTGKRGESGRKWERDGESVKPPLDVRVCWFQHPSRVDVEQGTYTSHLLTGAVVMTPADLSVPFVISQSCTQKKVKTY